MKLRFRSQCRDKYNGELYEARKVYEFDEARGNEILLTGYAEKVQTIEEVNEEIKAKEAEEKVQEKVEAPQPQQEEPAVINLYDLKKDDVIKIAKKVGVATRGTKEDIIERILAKECPQDE